MNLIEALQTCEITATVNAVARQSLGGRWTWTAEVWTTATLSSERFTDRIFVIRHCYGTMLIESLVTKVWSVLRLRIDRPSHFRTRYQLHVLVCVEWYEIMIAFWEFERAGEKVVVTYLLVLYRHSPGGTKQNILKPLSEESRCSGLEFEPGTSRIKVGSITAWANL
jgi:hypothetical protein